MHGGSLAEAAVPEFTGAAAARHTLDRLLTVPPPWCSQTYDVTVHNRHVTPADVLRLAGPVTTISDTGSAGSAPSPKGEMTQPVSKRHVMNSTSHTSQRPEHTP